ncbi:prepilin peptidase [Clostridium sp. ZS2-4]|uniref:prepilin peptidase n=1 Tax=Clostridium sp. ZS2-4 TaxID=2987703 RepID=UPI00227CBDCF|nr:A24 family peptidase [Clostridium sp. ZS2-4]MCY6354163.1 prepilin peptidase [Clostridium sp. ZS2-4]
MNIEIVFIALMGLVIGSFLNVCIYRIPRNEYIIFPEPRCTNCSTKLKPWDLIPVLSYLLLKGRCRYCGNKISFMYPIVEILTTIVFEILYFKYDIGIIFFIYAFMTSILIVMAFIESEHMIIPNSIVVIGVLAGGCVVIYNAFYPLGIYLDEYWWDPLLGAAIGSGFLFIASFFGALISKTNEAIGMGDVRIMAPVGLFLGWTKTIVILYLSIISAVVISIILILIGVNTRKDKIVFGPFISISTYITILYGQEIISWWFRITAN